MWNERIGIDLSNLSNTITIARYHSQVVFGHKMTEVVDLKAWERDNETDKKYMW